MAKIRNLTETEIIKENQYYIAWNRKNTVNEMKNAIKSINSRTNQAEERIYKCEDRFY